METIRNIQNGHVFGKSPFIIHQNYKAIEAGRSPVGFKWVFKNKK